MVYSVVCPCAQPQGARPLRHRGRTGYCARCGRVTFIFRRKTLVLALVTITKSFFDFSTPCSKLFCSKLRIQDAALSASTWRLYYMLYGVCNTDFNACTVNADRSVWRMAVRCVDSSVFSPSGAGHPFPSRWIPRVISQFIFTNRNHFRFHKGT